MSVTHEAVAALRASIAAIVSPVAGPTWTAMSIAESRGFEIAEVHVEHGQVCARSREGKVACWGDQFRLTPRGVGWALPTSTPHRLEQIEDAQDLVLAGGLFMLRSDGTIVFVRDSRIVAVEGFADIVQIETLGASICGRRRDGRVSCGGDLEWARSDSPDATEPIDLPLPPATNLACGLDGCCSWSESGVAHCVGDSAELGFSAQPRRLPFAGVTSITIGSETACATTSSGTQCWGEPLTRWFGEDWKPPRDSTVIPADPPCVLTGGELRCGGREQTVTIANVAAVATGGAASCALLASGALTCWGDNDNGSLGDGIAMARSTPALVEGITATRVTAARDDSCAVRPDGELWCWGRGRGKPASMGSAAGIAVNAQYSATCDVVRGVRCRVPDIGGDDRVLHWEYSEKIRAAAVDRAMNACIVDEGGGVRCRFSLSDGGADETWAELAVAEPVTSIAAMSVGFVFTGASGRVFEWVDHRFDDDPEFVDAPKDKPSATRVAIEPVTEITAHQNGGCAVTRGGDVMCWGGIGFANDYARIKPAAIEGLHGAHGLSANHFHVCGIVGDEARCFGDNQWGQLGRTTEGDGATRAERVVLPAAVVQVAAGAEHTCAVLVDARVYCWGSDRAGQLGQGRVIRSEMPVASVLGPAQSR